MPYGKTVLNIYVQIIRKKEHELTTTFINLTCIHCNEPELNLCLPEIINKIIGKNVYNIAKCLKRNRINFKTTEESSLFAT